MARNRRRGCHLRPSHRAYDGSISLPKSSTSRPGVTHCYTPTAHLDLSSPRIMHNVRYMTTAALLPSCSLSPFPDADHNPTPKPTQHSRPPPRIQTTTAFQTTTPHPNHDPNHRASTHTHARTRNRNRNRTHPPTSALRSACAHEYVSRVIIACACYARWTLCRHQLNIPSPCASSRLKPLWGGGMGAAHRVQHVAAHSMCSA